MRLNKYISETGVCSRREADKWIEAGRVTLNGMRGALGLKVAERMKCESTADSSAPRKSRSISPSTSRSAITCTTEPHIEDNIVDLVGHSERIFPIGRLDKDSEGLILLTNDGDIVNEILRSENDHEKEYIVTGQSPDHRSCALDDGQRRENHGRDDQALQGRRASTAKRFA